MSKLSLFFLLLALSCVISQTCQTAADCDDRNLCTVDTCANGRCQHTNSTDGTSCDDDLWCNGKDVCFAGTCKHLGDPCGRGAVCSNSCDEASTSCISAAGQSCDDGLFCNGADTCDGKGSCVSSGNPCSVGSCSTPCSESAKTCAAVAGSNCTTPTALIGLRAPDSETKHWTKTPLIIAPILGSVVAVVAIVIIVAVLISRRRRSPMVEAKIGLETVENDGGDAGFGSLSRLPNTGGVGGTSMMLTPVLGGSPKNSPLAVRRAVAYSAKAAERVRMESAARNIEEVEIGRPLGSGNFGEVFFGQWHQPQPNGTPSQVVEVALKKLHRPDKFDTFRHEVETLRELSHSNIVRYFGVFADHNAHEMYLATEYMSMGSVIELLQILGEKISEEQLVEMSLGGALGMAYLERSRIVHRDLSCRNLLVSSENGHYVVKVSDFGNAVCIAAEDEDFVANDSVFLPAWSAVEVLRDNLFSTKSDVWSFGVCMWEMFEKGKEPFAEVSKLQIAERVMRGERLDRPEGCADDLYDVMTKCWEESPADRPNFQQVLDLICGALQRRSNGEVEAASDESEGDASGEEEDPSALRVLQSPTEELPEEEETL